MSTAILDVGACISEGIEANVNPPRVQVISDDHLLPPVLTSALARTSATVTVNGYDEACAAAGQIDADAVVLVVPRDQGAARPRIEKVFDSMAKHPCGTLILTQSPLNGLASAARPSGLPVTFAEDPSEEELAGRLATIYEYGRPLRHMTAQVEDMVQQGKRIADEAQYLDEQLTLASQVQRDFLPHRTPQCDGVRFVTLFRPADYVSGDIYDLTRLDESHIGASVADVTGHGVPAALLTLFVKRAWQAKEIDGGSYRIIPPDELLYRLNRDVLEADLQQCQFITACCALYDHRQRVMTWARAGLPYPILVRPGQPPRQLPTRGELLGAFENPHFELRREPLQPGDTMVFHSDGLEALLLGDASSPCKRLEETEWFARLSQEPIDDQIAEISRLLDHVPSDRWPRDDVTILAVCVDH